MPNDALVKKSTWWQLCMINLNLATINLQWNDFKGSVSDPSLDTLQDFLIPSYTMQVIANSERPIPIHRPSQNVMHWVSDQASNIVQMTLLTGTLLGFRIVPMFDMHHRLSNDETLAVKICASNSHILTTVLRGAKGLQSFLTGPKLTRCFRSQMAEVIENLCVNEEPIGFLDEISEELLRYEWCNNGTSPFVRPREESKNLEAKELLRDGIRTQKNPSNRWNKTMEQLLEASNFFYVKSVGVHLVRLYKKSERKKKGKRLEDALDPSEDEPHQLLTTASTFLLDPKAHAMTWKPYMKMAHICGFTADLLSIGGFERHFLQKLENGTIGSFYEKNHLAGVDPLRFSGESQTQKNNPGGRKSYDPIAWIAEDQYEPAINSLNIDWSSINSDFFLNWFRLSSYEINLITQINPIKLYRWGLLSMDGLDVDDFILDPGVSWKTVEYMSLTIAKIAQRVRSCLIYDSPSIYRFIRYIFPCFSLFLHFL